MEAFLLEFILSLTWASLGDGDQGGRRSHQVDLLGLNILWERFYSITQRSPNAQCRPENASR